MVASGYCPNRAFQNGTMRNSTHLPCSEIERLDLTHSQENDMTELCLSTVASGYCRIALDQLIHQIVGKVFDSQFN